MQRQIFHFEKYDNKKFSVIMSIVIVSVLVDSSFSYADTIIDTTSKFHVLVFIVIAAVYVIGQYLILDFIKHKSYEGKIKGRFLTKSVSMVQYTITLVTIFIVLQIIFTSQYSTALLNWGSTISFSLAGSMLGLLALKFLSWYNLNRNFLVLLYGLAVLTNLCSIVLVLFLSSTAILGVPAVRDAHTHFTFPVFEPNTELGILQYLVAVVDFAAFLLLWASTVVLLYRYSRKMGKIKFWALLSIPLVSFTIENVVIGPLVDGIEPSPNSLYEVVFGASIVPSISIGILFGVPFWIVARSIQRGSIMRDYLIIAAWGLVFLQITSGDGVYTAPYPPFGLVGVSFIGLSCYLILVGLYYSAVSISQDVKLRQSIRNSLVDEPRLLDSIGSSQMEKDLQNRVMIIAKRNSDIMAEESGIEPTLTEDDAKQYLEEVLEELKNDKTRSALS
jgi:hypothetical protein